MPRKGRVEFAGAVYHVMDRGDRLEAIFLDADDRWLFLRTLGQACERTGWKVHSYVLMSNHYHILLETPEANMVAGMRWLQSTYTIRHNARHKLRGHLFQGRYKAILVDSQEAGYFQTASDYIHLNPARARLLGAGDALASFPWSSFPWLVGSPELRPAWLEGARVVGGYGGRDDEGGRARLMAHLESRAREHPEGSEEENREKSRYDGLRRGWCFGGSDFQRRAIEFLKPSPDKWRASHAEAAAVAILEEGLSREGLTREILECLPKSDVRKIGIAREIKTRTTVTNAWIAAHLAMGSPTRVSRYAAAGGDPWQEARTDP